MKNTEIFFEVNESLDGGYEGGYEARAIGSPQIHKSKIMETKKKASLKYKEAI